MANGTTCDTCGAPGAHRVEAAVALYDFIEGSPATGHAEGADACDTHRAATLTALHDASLAAVLADAPALAASFAAAARRDDAVRELDALRPLFAADMRGEGPVSVEIRSRRDELVKRAETAENERQDALRRQTEATALRTAMLAKALKAPKKKR